MEPIIVKSKEGIEILNLLQTRKVDAQEELQNKKDLYFPKINKIMASKKIKVTEEYVFIGNEMITISSIRKISKEYQGDSEYIKIVYNNGDIDYFSVKYQDITDAIVNHG